MLLRLLYPSQMRRSGGSYPFRGPEAIRNHNRFNWKSSACQRLEINERPSFFKQASSRLAVVLDTVILIHWCVVLDLLRDVSAIDGGLIPLIIQWCLEAPGWVSLAKPPSISSNQTQQRPKYKSLFPILVSLPMWVQVKSSVQRQVSQWTPSSREAHVQFTKHRSPPTTLFRPLSSTDLVQRPHPAVRPNSHTRIRYSILGLYGPSTPFSALLASS